MNVNCIICSDLFIPSSEIFTTTCGHLFHHACLVQWLERSRTCPQCRHKATEKTIHRIYFNFSNNDSIVEDPAVLQHKVDNLLFQLKLKEKDIQTYTDQYKKSKSQNAALREEIKCAQHKTTVTESALFALQDQVKYFKEKSKDNSKLFSENVALKAKIRDLENVSIAMSGSKEELSKILRDNRDPESLSLMIITLKRELMATSDNRKFLQMQLKQGNKEINRCKSQFTLLDQENTFLKNKVQELQTHEEKIKQLELKIVQLEYQMHRKQIELQSNKNEGLPDTQAPVVHKKPLLRTRLPEGNIKYKSPTVAEKVASILDSDSPYLQVKANNVCVPNAPNLNYAFASTAAVASVNAESTSSYDGLGGHTKSTETFTSSKSAFVGLKRTASNKNLMTKKKFKKLAPNNNKKIVDWVNLVDDDN